MTVHRHLAAAAAAATALVLCGSLVACSSSGGQPDAGTTSGSASGTSAAANGGSVAAAKAAVAKYEATPTKITVTQPLAKKPDPGKTVAYMACQLANCAQHAKDVAAAVRSVGWKYQQITYDQADPSSLVTGMRNALRYKPSYVIMSGVGVESWASVLPAYKKAGVKIIVSYLGTVALTDTIIANIGSADFYSQMGEQLAQWFIAESDGKGSALLQTINDYPSNVAAAKSFEKSVSQSCPACHIDTLNVGLADAGQGKAPDKVVSYLRAHPKDTYVVGTYLPFLEGLPSALGAAGLSGKIKVAGTTPSAADLPQIKSGAFAAATVGAGLVVSYRCVDAALRDETGTPQAQTPVASQLLLPGQDIPLNSRNDYFAPKDAVAQFEKLWGVS